MERKQQANYVSNTKKTLFLLALITSFFAFSQKEDFLLKYPGKQKAFLAGAGIGIFPLEDDNAVLFSIGLGLTTSLIQADKEGDKFDPGILGATVLGTLTTILLKKQIKKVFRRRKLNKNNSPLLTEQDIPEIGAIKQIQYQFK